MYGKGNLNTATFWEMDTRTLKRWNIDPVMKSWESSYAVFGGNPIMYNDVLGDDWFKDKNGKSKFDPKVQNQEGLKPGQTYIGKEFKERTSNGTADFRKDGSIMYSNETAAYKRMWDAAKEPGGGTNTHEVLGAIFEKGVLVLPDYKNSSTTAEIEEYGYKFDNGKLYDPLSKNKTEILGTIHTHTLKLDDGPSASPSKEDLATFPAQTPNKPFMTMGWDGKLHGAVGNKTSSPSFIGLPKGYSTNKDLLNGASLIKLFKNNKK